MKLHVKKGDNVVVLAGKDKGKTGKVLFCDPKSGNVKVDGVNIVTKHKKPRSAQVPGGIKKEEGNINSSNVQIICPSCNKATRVGTATVDSKKVRACKKCGASLDVKLKVDKKDKKKAPKKDTTVASVEDKPVKKAKTETKTADVSTKEPIKNDTVTAEANSTAAKKPTAKKEKVADDKMDEAKKETVKKPSAKKPTSGESK